MLPKLEIRFQAEAFLAFALKYETSGIPLQQVFRRWAVSKDFMPGDSRTIWQAVQALLSLSTPSGEAAEA